MSDPTITKALSYDRLGRTKREWRTFKNLPSYLGTFNKTYYTDFEHDLFSRKTEITYPADVNTGERLSARYTYSIQGTTSLVINYGQGNQTVVSSIKYNEFGQRTSLTRGNGVVTYYTYDNRNRLTDLATTTNYGGSTSLIHDSHYSFNIADSITGIEVKAERDPYGVGDSTIELAYQYDGLNRLIHAGGQYERDMASGYTGGPKQFERTYSYALNGNLLGKNIVDPETKNIEDGWSYSYTNHAVTEIDSSQHGAGQIQMTYDDAGNMTEHADLIKGFTKTMNFDSANRIKTVTNKTTGKVVGQYYYDDGGFRIRRISNEKKTARRNAMKFFILICIWAWRYNETIWVVLYPDHMLRSTMYTFRDSELQRSFPAETRPIT